MLQFLVALRFGGQRFKLSNQIAHMPGAVVNVFLNRLRCVEHEVLRQVAYDQLASPRDIAAVRRLQPGQDAQKRRLPAAIAAYQPDALALVNGKRRAVAYHALIVADGEFSDGQEGG